MKRSPAGRTVAGAAACGLVLVLGGCASAPTSSAGPPSSVSAAPSAAEADVAAERVADQPFGPGCGAIPPAGEGSFAGMSDDAVGTAVGHSPAVSALNSAIRAAQLGPSFDSQQDITVLAPANAAFEVVPPNDVQALLRDTPRLTAVLTHHVIQGRLTPEQLAGTHTTLNNDTVTIGVSPEAFTVAAAGTLMGAAEARVVCGNVQTANATVYLIDQVLAPAA